MTQRRILVDSHVNLHSEKYHDDLDVVITSAHDAGVRFMLTICDRLESVPAMKAIAGAHNGIWRSVGVHPHHAKDFPELTASTLGAHAADEDVIAIGETGLDFYYEYSGRDAQIRLFREHIKAARETGLPLIIHTRDADEMMADILVEEYEAGAFTPLLHCYTGARALAETALKRGGYISFSGIITFKNAGDIREIARWAPLDRIIIETDCPYLAPAPMRGRRNEPAYLVHIAEKLAGIKGLDTDEIAAATTRNFFDLFSKADKEHAA